MSTLLAIETSSAACSAALLIDTVVTERYRLAPREHAELILRMVDELMGAAGLAPAELDAVAFARGPGAFTGVRIAASVAQGIAFGADRPVIPVSTLAALAQDAMDQHGADKVLAALDARMGEVYWGAYESGEDGLATPLGEERVCAPDQVPLPAEAGSRWWGAGSGWDAHGSALAARLGSWLSSTDPEAQPRARAVARLAAALWRRGECRAAEEALPVYLRDQVVQT